MGQNLGAKQPDRAEAAVWRTGLYNMIFLLGVAVIFVIYAEALIRFFTQDAEVIRFGVDCLRWIAYGYGFYAYGMVIVQAFNGAGDTTTPTKINFCCYWFFQIPLAYLLAHGGEATAGMGVGLGARGVFVAIPVAETALTLVAVLVFRRGGWKTQEI